MASYPLADTHFYFNNLYRIVEECMDLSFILCNSELEQFTMAKIFDVFNQAFPTAIVLNTGFWPFFNNIKGQCLCVCGRYGFQCRHQKNSSHWIDLQTHIESQIPTTTFYPKYYGHLYPIDYFIHIEPVNNSHHATVGFVVNISLKLQHKKSERAKKRLEKARKASEENLYTYKEIFSINARYSVCQEYYPAPNTYVFQPNPHFHDLYGNYFYNLIKNFGKFPWFKSLHYIVQMNQIPNKSLRLFEVNLPTYHEHFNMAVIPMQFQQFKMKFKKFRTRKVPEPVVEPEKTMNMYSNINSFQSNQITSELVKEEFYDNDLQIVSCSFVRIEPPDSPNCEQIFASRAFKTPKLENFTNLTKEQLDEEFDIIKEVIEEDLSSSGRQQSSLLP